MQPSNPVRRLPRYFALALLFTSLITCGSNDLDPTEVQRIVDLLDLRPGVQLADLGAGDGDWSADLASIVGHQGKIWATEVEEDKIEELRERFEESPQIQVVSGDDQKTGLPTDCCDAIFTRLVYHHFTDPKTMQADLCRALRPDGRLLIVDILPQESWDEIEDVPDRGGHGIPPEALISEMNEAGFDVIERHDDWPGDEDRYAVLFSACKGNTG